MSIDHPNPYEGFTYQLFVGGIPQAGFSEANVQAETVNFINGLSTSLDFHQWLQDFRRAKSVSKTIEMTVYGEAGEEISTWQIEDCLPTKVRTSEAIIEILFCKHDGFTQLS